MVSILVVQNLKRRKETHWCFSGKNSWQDSSFKNFKYERSHMWRYWRVKFKGNSFYCTIVVQWVSCNQEITNLLTTPLAATHALFWNRLPPRMIIQLELVWVLLEYKWLNLWASEYMMLKNWNVYNCNICKEI